MSLCQYKDVLGVPKQGFHSYRILNIAIMDVLATIVGAYLMSWYFQWSFGYTLLILFILGIILHRVFCVRTTIDRVLFPDPSSV